MIGKLKAAASGLKDTALSVGAKEAINARIREIGRVETLRIDTARKSLNLVLTLDGEPEALEVEVGRYTLCREEGKCSVRLEGIRTSRRWIDTLGAQHLEGRRCEVPEEYAGVREKLI
jgi:hypothetical protein